MKYLKQSGEGADLILLSLGSLTQHHQGGHFQTINKYLDKHLKRCLEKEEREAIFKAHPRPDSKVCTVPIFLGSKFPNCQTTNLRLAVVVECWDQQSIHHFQLKLTNRVEKETALAKAVSINRSKKRGQQVFFDKALPSSTGTDRAGSTPYHKSQKYPQRGGYRQFSRPGWKLHFHESQLPHNQASGRPYLNKEAGTSQKRS